MSSLFEILADPKLNAEEIARLTAARDEAKKAGHYLDADAYAGALQLHTDAAGGIERCYSCGRVKDRRFTKPR